MYFRDGAKEFLKEMNDRGIPIIVISAGVGNIIQQFFIYKFIYNISYIFHPNTCVCIFIIKSIY